jgi:nucleotide-binding universal stress UspA family protein
MSNVSKIVVGYDGGSEARDGLQLGGALAKTMRAELVVAYALAPMLELQTSMAARFGAVFAQARSELPDRDFVIRELRDVSAPAGLADVASSEEAALIVIGSTHRGMLGRTFPGSVGERLLSRAQCPVLVAPRGFAHHEHFGVGLVGVAIDGSDESTVALQVAGELAVRLEAGLRVITIFPRADGDGAHVMETLAEDRAKDIQARAQEHLPSSLDVEFALEDGDASACLARHGVELDFLVIGSRGRGPLRRALLGGVSTKVMQSAPCPVLVVPRSAAAGLGPEVEVVQ